MKMNFWILLLLSSFLLLFFKGCGVTGETVVGYFFLVSSSEAGRTSASTISAEGDIEKISSFKREGTKVFGGELSLNGKALKFDSSLAGRKANYGFILMSKVEIRRIDTLGKKPYSIKIPTDQTDDYFGRNITWKLNGSKDNGIAKFTEEIYSPEILILSMKNGSKISTALFEITWNADTANKAGVNIAVYYTGKTKRQFRADTTNILWRSASSVHDNGRYMIDTRESLKFPENGMVVITIDRKTEKRVRKGINQEFLLMSASYSSGIYELESGKFAKK